MQLTTRGIIGLEVLSVVTQNYRLIVVYVSLEINAFAISVAYL